MAPAPASPPRGETASLPRTYGHAGERSGLLADGRFSCPPVAGRRSGRSLEDRTWGDGLGDVISLRPGRNQYDVRRPSRRSLTLREVYALHSHNSHGFPISDQLLHGVSGSFPGQIPAEPSSAASELPPHFRIESSIRRLARSCAPDPKLGVVPEQDLDFLSSTTGAFSQIDSSQPGGNAGVVTRRLTFL